MFFKTNKHGSLYTVGINYKELVASRYDVVTRYNFHNETTQQMLDRYIPQVIEELAEYQEEFYMDVGTLPPFSDEMKYELIDVIYYLASIIAEVKYKFNTDVSTNHSELKTEGIRDFYVNDNHGTVFYPMSHTTNVHTMYISGGSEYPDYRSELIASNNFPISPSDVSGTRLRRVITDVIFLDAIPLTLGRIRTVFRERKYHKPYSLHDRIDENYDSPESTKFRHSILTDNLVTCINLCVFAWTFNSGVYYDKRGLTVAIDESIDELNRMMKDKSIINEQSIAEY